VALPSAALAGTGEAEVADNLRRMRTVGICAVMADQKLACARRARAREVMLDQAGATGSRDAIEQQVHVVEAQAIRCDPVNGVTHPDPVGPLREPALSKLG